MDITSVPGAVISFPMFGEGFAIDPPSTLSIFGLTLHWYGIIIACGFVLAYFYVCRRCNEFGFTQDDFLDILLVAVPVAIICARVYYVMCEIPRYKDNWWDAFKIWEGGIAIYGGIIGAVLVVILMAKKKKIPFGAIMDLGGMGFLIGQTIGRWGNFMNREAFGGMTDVFCKMGLTNSAGETIYVHPTFLYESLWNLVGFILIHKFSKKRKYDGQMFAMYVAWYGFGRMLIEGLRTDSLYIPGTPLRISQVLAGLTVIGAVIFMLRKNKQNPDPKDLFVNKKIALAEAEGISLEEAEEAKISEEVLNEQIADIKDETPEEKED